MKSSQTFKHINQRYYHIATLVIINLLQNVKYAAATRLQNKYLVEIHL